MRKEIIESSFLTEDFLLQNDFAKKLYHDYVARLPIIDYHCHLPPQEIADDKKFENLTQIWLDGDHYKWRAMRALGIQEDFITGKAPDEDKFAKWAHTVPYTLRNPLYHWSHLELRRYFGIEDLLSENSASQIYEACNHLLSTDDYSTQSLIRKMNVETVCTTDDPADSLDAHQKIASDPFGTRILPTFRPDKAYAVENPTAYNEYLRKLGDVTNISIQSFEQLLQALANRVDYFDSLGCRLSDHGLEQLYYADRNDFDVDKLFKKAIDGNKLTRSETDYYKYRVLHELGKMYYARGWTQQYHVGAIRNTNSRMMRQLGPDTGFDSVGDFSQARAIALFLNELDSTDQLAKTILYNLNPSDNEVMATMIGNFNDGSVKGKIQFGSAWWFLDQKDGMEKQLNALSNFGMLSCFVGMLTDSRSFLSYPRHEYFRRILCNLLGKDVENGELPSDEAWLGKIASDICYYNAKTYFNFNSR